MEPGQAITIWMARAAALAYLTAIILMIRKSRRAARIMWTVGLITFLLHVFGAFEYFYHWSHSIAFRETARQTGELFGVNWGGGLYLNYLFTVVWLVDCGWWWVRPDTHRIRSVAISAAVHAFLGFMFLNATVVVWALRVFR